MGSNSITFIIRIFSPQETHISSVPLSNGN